MQHKWKRAQDLFPITHHVPIYTSRKLHLNIYITGSGVLVEKQETNMIMSSADRESQHMFQVGSPTA